VAVTAISVEDATFAEQLVVFPVMADATNVKSPSVSKIVISLKKKTAKKNVFANLATTSLPEKKYGPK
jgi:hypothetical protein